MYHRAKEMAEGCGFVRHDHSDFGVHRGLLNDLRASGVSAVEEIADRLDEIRKKRIIADYNSTENATGTEARLTINMAKNLLKMINEFERRK